MRKKSSSDKLHNNFICQSGFLSEYTKTMKNEIINEHHENTARKIKEKFIFKRERQNTFAGDDYFERLFL